MNTLNTTDRMFDEQSPLRWPMRLCNVALAAGLLTLCGCAFNRPVLVREEIGTNGTVIARTQLRISTYALWPATSQLAKQKASLGKSTMSVGTDSLDLQSGGTNLTESLKALGDLVGKLTGK